jgi:aminopeptidase N
MKRRFLLHAYILALASIASAQRLPETAVPENYKLTFAPDFDKNTFTVQETIRVRVLKPISEIVLNAADVDFQEVSISSQGATQSASISLNKEKETVTLAIDQALQSGPAIIQIECTGILNSEMRGFYLGKDDQGRKYAATQFEPTDARRAFPSFDEPAYKATFDIALIVDKDYIVISNNKAISDTPGPGADKHTVRFATTAKISSYLAAWVTGKFEYIEGSADETPIRVYSTPGKKELGRFALEVTEYTLGYYDRYFGIKYPYGKLDLIALPDFSAGAMENVGLITSREAQLLADANRGSLALKKSVAVTITHEIAHQWFGDLVTMRWWDDVWLNEGFATWMEGKPVDAWKPEWHAGLDEISGGDILTTFGALNLDSLQSARPIHQRAETPGQIMELFDGIAYGKTAAVLRMIEAYLGPETFRAGVNEYLKLHAYGNSTADDFWNTLAKISGKPVDKIMPTFVQQPGVPIIRIKAECSGNSTTVSLRQQRYLYDRAAFSAGDDKLWQVPVCVKTASSQAGVQAGNQCELLTRRESTLRRSGCSNWVLGNAGGSGYYRSGYESAAVRALANDAVTALTPLERLILLADTWAAVRIGRQPVGDVLTLAKGLQPDRTDAVLTLTLGYLTYVGNNLVTDDDREAYQTWVRGLLTPIAKDVGWQPQPGEPDEREDLRARVLEGLGGVGHDQEAIAEALTLAEQALNNPTSVENGLAGVAFTIAASNGDAALYEKLLAAIKTAKTPEHYYLYLFALSSFSDPALLLRTLQFAISPDVRSQDTSSLIGAVMGNPEGRRLAWDFVRWHWAEVEQAGGPFAGAQIEESAGGFCDTKYRDEVKDFFSAHKLSAGERTLKQSLERINNCIDLKSLQSDQLASWLHHQSSSAGN